MRALVAVSILVVWSARTHARAHEADRESSSGNNPVANLLACTNKIGVVKCITAYGAWRAEKSVKQFEKNYTSDGDDKRFPWERYINESEEDVYSKLTEETEKLLRHRSLSMDLGSDYALELGSANGTLSLDLIENNEQGTGRGKVKKIRKYFYQMLPALLIPGLIISAILPFVLPAFKMMVVGAGMLNNMALMGAVFTLLRNNAFNDKYEKKVIYINEGYKNERLKPLAAELSEHFVDPNYIGGEEVTHDIQDYHVLNDEDSLSALDGYAVSADWIKKFNEVRGTYDNLLAGNNKRIKGREHRIDT